MKKIRFTIWILGFCGMVISCGKGTTSPAPDIPKPDVEEPKEETFTNPLLTRGADPWITQKDGTYYYTYTHGSRVVLYVTKKISELDKASQINAWIPPPNTMYSENIWAPELHEIDGNWYIYFTATGSGSSNRMYVLENKSGSPTRGNWEFKAKIADSKDQWAIDGNVMKYNGQLYILWSGGSGGNQQIFIAKMSNPWTIEGTGIQIGAPQYDWEKHRAPSGINEGPQALFNPEGDLFVIFSASLYLSDNYCLGWLRLKKGGDPLNPSDWTKHPEPVFSMNAESGAYGPGHNGFFKSPDGTEDWIIYHARNLPDGGNTNYRNPRIQKFTWNADGTPNFGIPVKIGEAIKKPSGE